MSNQQWIEKFISLLQLNDKAAYPLKDRNIPEYLYKYISLDDYAQEKFTCLANDQIWIAGPETMNDPYDSGLYFLKNILANAAVKQDFFGFANEVKLNEKFTPDEINKIREAEDIQVAIYDMVKQKFPDKADDINRFIPVMESMQTKWHEQLLDGFNSKIKSSLKISCFTEVKDSLLMWSHYANSHKGICIEYNFRQLPADDLRKHALYPVNYSEKFLDATSLMKDIHTAPLIALLASLYKSPEWAYEKEWRLIIPGEIMPTDSPFKVPKPVSIYLGSKIGKSERENVIELCQAKGIPAFQMRTKYSAFGFSEEPIET